jgi:Cu2+-containing amine oxidase
VRLKLDGSVEVRVTMAGVVLSLFHDPGGATEREGPFNRRVHTYVNAPLHDHLSNWKVDIDVAGTNNSFLKESVRSGSYEVRRTLLADLWRQQAPLGPDLRSPARCSPTSGGSKRHWDLICAAPHAAHCTPMASLAAAAHLGICSV